MTGSIIVTGSIIKISLSLALFFCVLLLARRIGRRYALHAEVQRKIVHVSLGLYALTFPLIFSEPWEVVTLCALAAAVMLGVRVAPSISGPLGSALHGVGRRSFGELLFAFSIAILFVISEDRAVLYILPLLILVHQLFLRYEQYFQCLSMILCLIVLLLWTRFYRR